MVDELALDPAIDFENTREELIDHMIDGFAGVESDFEQRIDNCFPLKMSLKDQNDNHLDFI
jgi:hypothetical protein